MTPTDPSLLRRARELFHDGESLRVRIVEYDGRDAWEPCSDTKSGDFRPIQFARDGARHILVEPFELELPWSIEKARELSIEYALHVLPNFERERPGDGRPRRAIEAARAAMRGEHVDLAAAREAAYDESYDREYYLARVQGDTPEAYGVYPGNSAAEVTTGRARAAAKAAAACAREVALHSSVVQDVAFRAARYDLGGRPGAPAREVLDIDEAAWQTVRKWEYLLRQDVLLR